MRVAGRAILAERCPAGADAVAALIDDHPVAGYEIANAAAGLFDNADELMSENLWRLRKRDWAAALVRVVVAVPGEDVEVGAAQADSGDSQQHLARSGRHERHVPYFETADVGQDGRTHQSDTDCSAQTPNSRCLVSSAFASTSPEATRPTCSNTRCPT